MTAPPPSVAFLGLGLMGAPMAARVAAAGLPLAIWNRSLDKAAALAGPAMRAASAPADAAAGADIIALCLLDAAAVEQVLFAPDGALAGAGPDALIVDFSTIGVAATRDLAARAGRAWVDAPVSGGVAGAMAGSLTIFCGGDAADIGRARPLLDAVAAHVTAMGALGAGQATKLCNQIIVANTLLALAEAVAAGHALGLDVSRLPGALAGGFADSPPLRQFGAAMVSDAEPTPRGRIATMAKDVEAAAEALAGTDMPLLSAARTLYRQALALGLGPADLARLPRLYAKTGED
ncbi:NAD(P)-dependent oxidoreductase [Niveispirillum fermenti]|uniref:NAD(P)-dependent oxidoreductase n=1 Tax=Niveispirillum fermenti TaxID=1233113 RepID=UPI003A87C68F